MINKLNHEEIKKIWNQNADLWVRLSREGYDLYRDYLSTPGFLKILPSIAGLTGLDIGCGEGHNTKLLAQAGAEMIGIDISENFIELAKKTNENSICYLVEAASDLSFANETFDFVVAFNSLMGMPDFREVLREIYRVLKSGGFFQFSITHPCFWRQNLTWIKDKKGKKKGVVCNDYFHSTKKIVGKWMFDGVDPDLIKKGEKFETPLIRRTLSEWLNSLIQAGFIIEEMYEPQIEKSVVSKYPGLDGARIIPFF